MKQIRSVLLLGSGAIKIGEAGEFDYSGTQAIKALKEEKIKVILVNPNVATIQTSPGLADRIYFVPVQADFVEQVIKKEKPDGILLSFGGQTALNCGIELFKRGILKKHHVEILGTPISSVIATEDRKKFAKELNALQLATARGQTVTTSKAGKSYAKKIGYPVMLRSGFALGGTGSGVAHNEKELMQLMTNAFSIVNQIIIEENLTGWKEVEYEVVRDRADNVITVCNMENMDPVGIHTGESIVVAPSQTLNDAEYFGLRDVAMRTIRALNVVGECNIQFALHPQKYEYRIIEVNARLSRSSALASKATGYPLAYIAAKLALGYTLPELQNCITKKTTAFFEPALDYVTVKLPRWDLDKYDQVEQKVGSEMKSVGEVMAIARTFGEAIQKAARMLGEDYLGVIDRHFDTETISALLKRLSQPSSMRLFTICHALSRKITIGQIQQRTGIDRWFLEELAVMVSTYKKLQHQPLDRVLLQKAKQQGFSDQQIADCISQNEDQIRALRLKWGIVPSVKRIDTLAGEFPAQTNYLYVTYNASQSDHQRQRKKAAIVIGSGPYAIGTSVEFDWCAVNTVMTLRKNKIRSIVINCNPETVSTDYDYSDVLYFEEMSLERVLDIYEVEKAPFILSMGGQIPNNLASGLHQRNVPILGTKATDIFRAEHRKTFSQLLDKLHIKQPGWGEVYSLQQAKRYAWKLGYPVLVRPSFVLSGKGMSVIETETQLSQYMEYLKVDLHKYPLVMTAFLDRAKECDVDGVAVNGVVIVSILAEHIENAGVHSGDATLSLPASTLSEEMQALIKQQVVVIVKSLYISGPFNIQFLVRDEIPYVIECNSRASRSFPYISKTYGVNLIEIATEVMLGTQKSAIKLPKLPFCSVKSPQFSFNKLRGADPVLRVEMSSTGEVAGFASTFEAAYLLSILSTGYKMPTKKAVFISLGGLTGKLDFLYGCQILSDKGYTLYATEGTHFFLRENGIDSIRINKQYENKEHNVTELLLGRRLDFAVVIPERFVDTTKKAFYQGLSDGYRMRRLAIDLGVPIFTNAANALFFVKAIRKYQQKQLPVVAWQDLWSRHRKEVL